MVSGIWVAGGASHRVIGAPDQQLERRLPALDPPIEHAALYSTGLCLNLLGDLSMRLHACVHEIDHLALQNSTFRVVNYLIEQLPVTAANGAIIELAAPKNVIAARVSIKPETLSRILHNLVQEGIISTHGKTIQVHDIERLRGFLR